MLTKPSKNQYLLLFVSLILFVLCAIFWRDLMSAIFAPESIAMSWLLLILPALLISTIPSYVLTKIVNVKTSSVFINGTIFTLSYIIISFIGVAILFASAIN